MKYARPEILALGSAIRCIQGSKPSSVFQELPGFMSVGAYEADE